MVTCIINYFIVTPRALYTILLRNTLLHFLSTIINSLDMGLSFSDFYPLTDPQPTSSKMHKGLYESCIQDSPFLQLLFALPFIFSITFHGSPFLKDKGKIPSVAFIAFTPISYHFFHTWLQYDNFKIGPKSFQMRRCAQVNPACVFAKFFMSVLLTESSPRR